MSSRVRAHPSAPIPPFEDHEEAFFDEGHRLADEPAVDDFRDLDKDVPRRSFFRRLRDAFRFAKR